MAYNTKIREFINPIYEEKLRANLGRENDETKQYKPGSLLLKVID